MRSRKPADAGVARPMPIATTATPKTAHLFRLAIARTCFKHPRLAAGCAYQRPDRKKVAPKAPGPPASRSEQSLFRVKAALSARHPESAGHTVACPRRDV